MILYHLQMFAEKVCPESQRVSRFQHSTISMVFCVLQTKCNEENVPLYIAFIYLTKASDLLSTEELYAILLKIGWPPSLLDIAKLFYFNTNATVQYDGNVTELFKIKSRVEQDCVLAPTVFGFFYNVKTRILLITYRSLIGAYKNWLAPIQRLKAKSKVQKFTDVICFLLMKLHS